MSSRALKKQVFEILSRHDFAEIQAELDTLPAKGVVNALFPTLCREVPQLRWFGISCIGQAVARLARADMEEARVIMRRLMWSLNDESGGIGWGAPEAMAEIMALHQGLAGEYSHMLVSYMREDGDEPLQDGNYLEHVMLQRGLLWGIGRLSLANRDLMAEKIVAADLEHYLDSADTEVRGLAAWAAGILGYSALNNLLQGLLGDQGSLMLYLDGQFNQTTVATLANDAIRRNQSRGA